MKNIFNKNVIAACLFALLPLAGSAMAVEPEEETEEAAEPVTVSGGTLNFTGSVVSSACAIGADSANIDIALGQVRSATLAEAGSEASTAKNFSIVLEDCDTTVSGAVAVTFSGTPDAKDPTALAVGANGGAAAAQNVAIRIFDEAGAVVKLGETSSAVTLRNGENTLNFSAKYYSANGGATAGDASAVATYTLTYS